MSVTRTEIPLIGAAVSTLPDAREAVREALEAALRSLGAERPDLVLVFASPHHAAAYPQVLERVAARAPGAVQLGCGAEGVIATGQEVEDGPGIAVWAARLPGVSVEPVRLRFRRSESEGYIEGFEPPRAGHDVLLLLADPFTFPADAFVEHLNEAAPGLAVVGGMASGAERPGATRLFLGGALVHEGAVGAILGGNVAVATVVSQGCRPVGPVFSVTAAQGNVVRVLDGSPALRRLEEVYSALAEREQVLMRRGLHMGIAMAGHDDELGRGDFLIRSVTGADAESGAIAIGDTVEEGQRVQFHVRDADSAREDLRLLLDAERLLAAERPVGALLFSCNGRGQKLFGQPHHDAAALGRAFGSLPVAGFFCAGELGPVAGRNFLHGFTASIALFLPPTSL